MTDEAAATLTDAPTSERDTLEGSLRLHDERSNGHIPSTSDDIDHDAVDERDAEASAGSDDDTTESNTNSKTYVVKRDGSRQPVDLNKILNACRRCADGLRGVDAMRVATSTIAGIHDGVTSSELDNLAIRNAAALIAEEPGYSTMAARILATVIHKEVEGQNIHSFSQSVAAAHRLGLMDDDVAEFVEANQRKLNQAVADRWGRDDLYTYFGLRTVYDRYLQRHPQRRTVIETPQYWLMRVACGLADTAADAIEFYDLTSKLDYLPSSPTLFNSGTNRQQMSSCYLLDSPDDSLDGIYTRYHEIARLSKFAGGIGVSWSRVRSKGSHIAGTNGLSNGIIPWLKTLDSSVSAVNQGGRRKGAACVYLETWHADVNDFLELRNNTGDTQRRAHHINLANWVPDLFMRRVVANEQWSLFDPKVAHKLPDLWGDEFDAEYERLEAAGEFTEQLPARDLYGKMMRTLAETGNGWMTFKDAANRKSNQTLDSENVVHLSNLCTEIIEVTSTERDEPAVCNLGSVNLARCVDGDRFDFRRLTEIVHLAVPRLDRVIDRNFYPTGNTDDANAKWRPIGLGVMGLADVFFKLKLPFTSPDAMKLGAEITECLYLSALEASAALAKRHGAHPNWERTRAAHGQLQPDLWDVGTTAGWDERWQTVRDQIAKHGLRNSLVVAIAPTATIASIAGCYECIEPQVSNVFKRETLSGEFLQINPYLVRDLQDIGMWNDDVRDRLRAANGSVRGIPGVPDDIVERYLTAWEMSQRDVIDAAAARAPFIDQSQSLNLFIESPTIGALSSMYRHAWERGIKTTYYLRSRPATRINQSSGASSSVSLSDQAADETDAALACSLENPDTCEACQ